LPGRKRKRRKRRVGKEKGNQDIVCGKAGDLEGGLFREGMRGA